MTTRCETEESLGDIVTATGFVDEMTKLGQHSLRQNITAALWQNSDVNELLQGFGTLIYCCMSVITPRCLDEDALHMIVPAVLTELRALPDVADDVVPMMSGVLTAAALDLHPTSWRVNLGAVPEAEKVAWSHTAWLLATYIDLHQGRGTVSKLMTETFATMW